MLICVSRNDGGALPLPHSGGVRLILPALAGESHHELGDLLSQGLRLVSTNIVIVINK